MQTVSETWSSIASGTHSKEYKVEVYASSGTALLATFGMDALVSVSVTNALFDTVMSVGNCPSAQLDLSVLTSVTIPRMARLEPWVRLVNSEQQSEWLRQGIYWIDTRSRDATTGVVTIHAYDAMLKAEQVYCSAGEQSSWPKTMEQVAYEAAARIGSSIDTRTQLHAGYVDTDGIYHYYVQYPGYGDGAYTIREVLGYIAAANAGSWVITPAGKLRLIRLNDLPVMPSRLITDSGEYLTIGGDYISVG